LQRTRRTPGSAAGPETILHNRRFCAAHRGLALIHGLRHRCRACKLWNLVGTKEAIDPGHRFALETYGVNPPTAARGETSGPVAVRYRRWCRPGVVMRRDAADMVFMARWWSGDGDGDDVPSYRDPETGRRRRVPRGAWYWLAPAATFHQPVAERDVEAWLRLEQQHWRTGAWTVVDERERLGRIFEHLVDELGRREDGDLISTDATPFFCKHSHYVDADDG
jgi:hypothetical protein